MNSFAAMAQQADTNRLKDLYDRCIDLNEDKADSISYYADYITREAARLHYDRGDVLSFRLKGIAADLKGNYDTASKYYLLSLGAAKKLHTINYEGAAINDLAYLYEKVKQLHKSRDMFLEGAKLAAGQNDIHSLVVSYLNLGAIYTELKLPDSGLVYLNEGLKIAEPYKKTIDITSFYNNIGNVYFQKKDYEKALAFFRKGYQLHLTNKSQDDLWITSLNIAETFIEMGNFDSAYEYAQKSLQIAERLSAKSKQADSYAMLAKLYSRKGDFKLAYDFQQKWYAIDTSLVNENTNAAIANLQEHYNAKQREQDNLLLQGEIKTSELRTKITSILAIAAGVIALLVAVSLIQKRLANKKLSVQNELISRQNEKLAELNFEKNSLISIVSHDLSSPFATVKMWSQVLQSESGHLTDDQKKAIERIEQASANGERLIRTILDVEKAETNQHKLHLENLDLKVFVENIVADFRPNATNKNIKVHFETEEKHVYIVTDRQLVSRICENLFSNAIKYTPAGKNVWISLSNSNDAVNIKVRDEGVGIEVDELPFLFSRYSKISSKPTDGEASTGLGLSIVKRIVEELNGSVFCESQQGEGSLFTVVLKK